MVKQTNEKIVIGICGEPNSGKTVIASFLKEKIEMGWRQYISANVDGEGTVGDAVNQEFLNAAKKKRELTPNLSKKVHSIINNTDAPIVIVDIGGLQCFENAQILTCCDYCVIVNKDENGQKQWRKFVESLQPGKLVEYVERIGTPVSEETMLGEETRIGYKDGVKYEIRDVPFSIPYEELSLGNKSPKIVLEIDSRRTQDNPDVQNSVREEDGIVKAVLVDLERGMPDKIKSKISIQSGEKVILKLSNERKEPFFKQGESPDVFTEMLLFMLKKIKLPKKKERAELKENRILSDDIEFFYRYTIRRKLSLLDAATQRVDCDELFPEDEPGFNQELFMNFNFEECRNEINSLLIELKPSFVKNGRINYMELASLIGNPEFIQGADVKKLILLYDILLDSTPPEAFLYGTNFLLSIAAFAEEAKKDGIPSISTYSHSYGRYIECQRLETSSELAQKASEVIKTTNGDIIKGAKANGITFYLEKNDESKTAMMYMIFDDSLLPHNIDSIVLPEISSEYKLYFAGVIPDWFIGSLSYSYDSSEKAIMKPDTRNSDGKHLITYASMELMNLGMMEANPPGINTRAFLNKIPNPSCTFKTRSSFNNIEDDGGPYFEDE